MNVVVEETALQKSLWPFFLQLIISKSKLIPKEKLAFPSLKICEQFSDVQKKRYIQEKTNEILYNLMSVRIFF